MIKWIRVEDRLPACWQAKMIAGVSYWKSETNVRQWVETGFYNGEWRNADRHSFDPARERVTHWADFPEGPESWQEDARKFRAADLS